MQFEKKNYGYEMEREIRDETVLEKYLGVICVALELKLKKHIDKIAEKAN